MFGQSSYGTTPYGTPQVTNLQAAVQYLHRAIFNVYMSFKKVFNVRI